MGGSLRKQTLQALSLSGCLVKGLRVQGGIEDICADSTQTPKGLSEDPCSELAVYQNLKNKRD